MSICASLFHFSDAGPASPLTDTLVAANQCSILQHHGGLVANCVCCHTHPCTCPLPLSHAHNDSNIALHLVPVTPSPMADVPDMMNAQVHRIHQPPCKSFEMHRLDITRLPQSTSTIGIQHANKCPQEALLQDTHTNDGTLDHTYPKLCMELLASSHLKIMKRAIPATPSGVRCLGNLCQQPVSSIACAGCYKLIMTVSSAKDDSLPLNADARGMASTPTILYVHIYCCGVHAAANRSCSPCPCVTTSMQLQHQHPQLGHPNAQSRPTSDHHHAFWRFWDKVNMSPYMVILQAVTMQDSLQNMLEAARLVMICLLRVEDTLAVVATSVVVLESQMSTILRPTGVWFQIARAFINAHPNKLRKPRCWYEDRRCFVMLARFKQRKCKLRKLRCSWKPMSILLQVWKGANCYCTAPRVMGL